MKNRLIFGFTLLSSVFLSSTVEAQENLVNFKDFVQKAISHNKNIQNSILETQKVVLDKQEVKGKLLPKLSVNGLYGYINSRVTVDLPTQTLPITGVNLFEGTANANFSTQLFNTGVTATQVIFSGLQITNGQKALAQKVKAQHLMTEASYDQLAQEIVNSFDQLMLLNELELMINDSDKRLKKEHLKVVKAIENGVAIPYDRDKIKLAMLELESKSAELESNRELLYFKLGELTGASEEELKKTVYKLDALILTDNAGQMNRKELEALVASKKAYEYVLKKEKGAKLPLVFGFGNVSYINAFNTSATVKDVSVLGDLSFQSNSFQMAPTFAVGVGVKWNVFEGKSHKSAVEKAKLDIEIADNKLIDTKEKLDLLQRKTKSDYDLANKKIIVHQQKMLIAKNNLTLASRQFEEGLQDVTERLEAENEFYKQSLSYYNQILSQRFAATELLKANGNLYQTIIK